MKKLIFVFLLLFVSSSVWAAEEFSFRGVKFGMTQSDVKNIETGSLRSSFHHLLSFDIDNFYQMEAEAVYHFKNDSLFKIAFYVEDIQDLTYLKKKYEEIKSSLLDVYGKPSDERHDEWPLSDKVNPYINFAILFKNKISNNKMLYISLYLNNQHDSPYLLGLAFKRPY